PAFEFVFHFNRQARQANKIVPCKWAGTPNKGSGLRAADGTISEYQHAGLPVQDFRIPDNVLRLTRHKGRGIETKHPAVFPVVLPEFLMRTYTDEGEVVFEPFGGSGTTILAGQRTDRRVRAIELAPAYVDLAIARWRMLHPDMPVTLADDGRDYDAVAAAQHDIPIERPRRLAPDSFGVGAPGSLRSIIAAARPAAAVHVRLPCAARVFAHLCRATACAAPRGGVNRAILSDMAGRFHETLRSLLGPWRAEKPPLPERWRAPPPGAVLAQRYVVFDLETTGLAPSRGDRLVQIGAVRLEAGQEAASFTTLVNPGRGIPALSTRFHGITDAMVADAPSIADAVAAFAAFAGDAVLVAHNAAFDRTVLTAAEQQDATPIHNPMLCSLLLARWLQPRELDMSLDGLCGRLGIVIEGRHHALGDARATASLWLHLLGRVTASGIDELPEIAKRSRMRDGIAEGPQKF
ncbi:MAG: exonuclease domain-containing protein, partial [Alphaproteobacteria bacterium]|nr:exonuclease domain-containing protein [Alphaproteobacteria bacterium]